MHVACAHWLKTTWRWRKRKTAAESLLSVRPSIAKIIFFIYFFFCLCRFKMFHCFYWFRLQRCLTHTCSSATHSLPLSTTPAQIMAMRIHLQLMGVHRRSIWWPGLGLVSSAGHFLRVLYTFHLPLGWCRCGRAAGGLLCMRHSFAVAISLAHSHTHTYS